MIIPCIDLMDGKVVQLVQGREKALERTLDEALALFVGFPLLHVIDLDAAMSAGENRSLVAQILMQRKARVGGGVRSVQVAKELVGAGAHQVIVGSAAYGRYGVNADFLSDLARSIGRSRVIVAIDTKAGHVAIDGWRTMLEQGPLDAIRDLEPYCGGFLCTNVDQEGLLQGTDLGLFKALRAATDKPIVVAGGITTMSEVQELLACGLEVALGMAVYTGRLDVNELRELLPAAE